MYRLLIVDDEETITDGLFEMFLNKMNLELEIYKAYSGTEAINLLNKVRIDIVLSDIHMPGMNGIQLLKEIRNKWPECRVIFLTGYNEFNYVYSAIQYQGVSYLLKTEGFDKIIQEVENGILELEKSLKAKEVLYRAEEQIKAAAVTIRKEYLNGIIKGEYSNEEINQDEFNRLNISLNVDQPVLLLLGRIDDLQKVASYSSKNKLLCTVKIITEQYLSFNTSYVHFVDDNLNLVWLIQPGKEIIAGNDYSEVWNKIIIFIKGSLELVQSSCIEAVDVSSSFVLDDTYIEWDKISERFSILKMFLNYRLGLGKGMLITDKRIMLPEVFEDFNLEDWNININRNTLDMLQISLDNWQKDGFTRALNILTDKLAGIRQVNYLPAQELYYSISLVFLSHINKWNLTERVGLKIDLHKLMLAGEHSNWNDAANYLKRLADIIFETQDYEMEKKTLDVIKRVQKHIDNNIGNADEITLVRLAELVHFNQSYLSRLFKQVSGTTLSDYISESRMRRAKELLETNEVKIQEIADMLGFSSPTNFARFFRKYGGVTPLEYRESVQARNE